MNSRASEWDALFMRFAADVAVMSRAVRLKVGAVAVRDLRVIAIGYNGTPAGEDNCCEDFVPIDLEPESYLLNETIQWKDGRNWVLRTKANVIHAEDNLMRFAEANNINTNGCTLYITHSPCPECCKKIASYGFRRVVYKIPFRDTSALDELSKVGVVIQKWN